MWKWMKKKILFKTSIFWEVTESRKKMYTVVYIEPMRVKWKQKSIAYRKLRFVGSNFDIIEVQK